MMGMTNYLALVGGGKNPKFAMNKAIIWDDMKGKVALEITALSQIRSVQLSRTHIAVVLQNSVRVYSFAKPPDLIHVYETTDNFLGLCCLGERKLIFPGRQSGHVKLVDLGTGNVSIIPAHSSALRVIQMSPDGELLATASDTGTLIRIWSTSSCAKIAELRRGIDPATIFSLGFSPSGALLACTSDKSTLHIYDVPHPRMPPKQRTQQQGEEEGRWGILGRLPLMPRVFSDIYSFTQIPFEAGNESIIGGIHFTEGTILGATRPAKGIIGWLDEDSLVVLGAGVDARWEKFVISQGDDGKRQVTREGWKRYLGNT